MEDTSALESALDKVVDRLDDLIHEVKMLAISVDAIQSDVSTIDTQVFTIALNSD